MQDNDNGFSTRRALLAGMGVATAGLVGGSMATANAQGNASPFRARRHAEDSWLGDVGGDHRVFIDSARAVGGIEAVHYAGNILDAHKSAYGGSDSDYAMFICYRRFSTPLGYGDAIWEKYGTYFNNVLKFPDPSTGEPFSVNPLTIPGRMDLPSMGATIQSVADRGVHFLVCAGATRGISHMLAQATDGSADDIFKELTSSGIVNSRFVPAGVMAATRAQEYGYTLLYSGE